SLVGRNEASRRHSSVSAGCSAGAGDGACDSADPHRPSGCLNITGIRTLSRLGNVFSGLLPVMARPQALFSRMTEQRMNPHATTHALHSPRRYRPYHLADLPRLHVLWRSQVARL